MGHGRMHDGKLPIFPPPPRALPRTAQCVRALQYPSLWPSGPLGVGPQPNHSLFLPCDTHGASQASLRVPPHKAPPGARLAARSLFFSKWWAARLATRSQLAEIAASPIAYLAYLGRLHACTLGRCVACVPVWAWRSLAHTTHTHMHTHARRILNLGCTPFHTTQRAHLPPPDHADSVCVCVAASNVHMYLCCCAVASQYA